MKATFLSAEYVYKDLVLAAEYFSVTGDITIADIIHQELDFEGYYASLSYRFTERFEAGAYYSVAYFDKKDRDGNRFEDECNAAILYGLSGFECRPKYLAWQKEFVLSTKFDINENWTLKAEGHFINGAGVIFLQDNPDGVDESSFMFAVKTTFSF